MNNNIAALLTNVYEIEGLLLVVTRHGKDTPSLVYKRIQKAAQELNEQCKLLAPEDEQEEAPVASAPAATPLPDPEPQPAAAAVFNELQAVEENVEEEQSDNVPVEDREPDEDISFEFIYDEEEPESNEEDEMEQSQQDDDDMPMSPFSFDSEAAMRALKDDDSTEFVTAGHTTQDQEDEATDQEDEVIDQEDEEYQEPARRDPAKDLRKSFSINDYYRFRRELFRGDETAMNSALDLIQAMRTADDVEHYFINELDWDAESDDVKDFLEIVRHHFE